MNIHTSTLRTVEGEGPTRRVVHSVVAKDIDSGMEVKESAYRSEYLNRESAIQKVTALVNEASFK